MSSAASSTATTSSSTEDAVNVTNAIQHVLTSNFDARSKECLQTLLKIVDNVLKQPQQTKFRTLRLSNPALQQKVVQTQGLGILKACGFIEGKDGGGTVLTLPTTAGAGTGTATGTGTGSSDPTPMLLSVRHKLASTLQEDLQVPEAEIPPVPQISIAAHADTTTNSSTVNSFNVYRGQRYDGQSAAVGANLSAPPGWKSQTERQVEELQLKKSKLEAKVAAQKSKTKNRIERRWKASRGGGDNPRVMASTGTEASSSSESRSDAALLAAQISKQQQQRQAMENRGFTTKAMRDLAQLQTAKVYSHAHLRIQFSDGSWIEGDFGTKETIGDVWNALHQDVLSSYIVESNNNDDSNTLVLFQTPPRTVFSDPSQTLQALGLVPAAKLFASWKKPPQPIIASAMKKEPGWFLNPSLFEARHPHQPPLLPNDTTKLPKAVSVLDSSSDNDDNDDEDMNGNKPKKNKNGKIPPTKKTKADKEAALLQRMMGGGKR